MNFDQVFGTCSDVWDATFQWLWMLTDTQRLLVPTAALVVTLLWTKMCPPRRALPHTAHEDAALYDAALERWSAASAADARQQVMLQAAVKPRRLRRW